MQPPCNTTSPFTDNLQPTVNAVRLRFNDTSRLPGNYRVTVHGDLIRGEKGQALDANHLPPWFNTAHYRTGDGVAGGTFESWFRIRQDKVNSATLSHSTVRTIVMPIATTTASSRQQVSCPACGGLQCLCRPRFFAGQLLTEEDLNRLDHYIVEKNKLHNRYLHGWGVVCGLEVVCHPCQDR